MSMYGSHSRLPTMGPRSNSRQDLASSSFRNDVFVGGNGYPGEFQEAYNYAGFTRTSVHGAGGGGQKTHVSMGGGAGGAATVQTIQNKAVHLHGQCNGHLQNLQHLMQTGGPAAEIDRQMAMVSECIEQLNRCGLELQQMRVPHDLFRSVDQFQKMQGGFQQSLSQMTQRRSRGSVGSMDGGRGFNDAVAWIAQQKRLIETAPWGDDPAAIEQQILSHTKYHSTIQRSQEVDRAREELNMRGDKSSQHALEMEWDSLQKMSYSRLGQLRDLQNILDEISRAIMWVNEKEEEELVFDWGDKNIDQYIPKKQESYSRLMRDLEEKEKELNKLKVKVDSLLNNNHPASDKIEAYMDTLQTQWSWLLQITKCIHIHLKENAAYSQYFKEANETYGKLQREHESIRNKFTCDKNTPLDNLVDLVKQLEIYKERIMENKNQVQSLVNKSKAIVRLTPRNPDEKSSSAVMVQALCDFKQDQKGIMKGNEGILKDNSQRSKWLVTGPGGMDMLIPSVCLLIPPPNPISIGIANKNEQYYEAIMSIWNQLYINIKSLISWQYCVQDINYINSMTLSMLSNMRPEEYRSIIKRLESHYQEFLRVSQGSDMFKEEDKKNIQGQYAGAQTHYDTLVVQLPNNNASQVEVVNVEKVEKVEKVALQKVAQQKTESKKSEPPKTESPKPSKPPVQSSSVVSLTLLSDLSAIRRRLEQAESGLTYHLHIPLGDNSVHECSQHLQRLHSVHQDLDSIRDEYLHLREAILTQLQGTSVNSEQAKFLRSELDLINQKIGGLQGLSSTYLQRLTSLKALLQQMLQVEDVVKVHEARLTEKDTTSLDLQEVQSYRGTLKQMKSDLDQKRDMLNAMDTELAKAVQWNSQVADPFHKCDVDLSKYSDLVEKMSGRWRHIQSQIDRRMCDLDKHEQQLKHYQQNSVLLNQWIDNTRKRQDSLQTTKFTDIQTLSDHLNQQKILHTDIKGKKEKVEAVQKDADTITASIKDYELQLASYTAGLETLLNIPIKRTMLMSPANVIHEEAGGMQSRYIELLTHSGDYYNFLGQMLKNMEELKLRNTRIELLEEELRRMKDDIQDRGLKNQSLEDALARYKLELNQSKEQLISVEEIKMTTAMKANAAQESLDSTQNQMKDLNDKLTRLTYQLDEEKRKRRLAEERYTNQQEEYETAVRRSQKELGELKWANMDLDKAVKDKEREVERLKILLEEEAARRRGAESDISKVRTQHSQEVTQLKQTHETQIHVTKTTMLKASQQREEDSAELRLLLNKLTAEKRDLEEELMRVRMSITQTEEQKSRAEAEAHQQRASVTEEVRKRSELEMTLRTVSQQRQQDELSLREASKSSQEKSRQISLLQHNLDEEGKRRIALELEISHLKQAQSELQTKSASYAEATNKLRASEQEIRATRADLERQAGERAKAEQNAVRLQSRIQELQFSLNGMQAELEKEKRAVQEEFTRRKRMEGELEQLTTTCREHTTTIKTLSTVQEEVSTSSRRYETERRALQEALDKSMRDCRLATEQLAQLRTELKTLNQKLTQEQTRGREAALRNELLSKTIEEKSLMLNEHTTEVEKLKSLTQNLTKERLRLEEEMRTIRQERDELRLSRDSVDGETAAQVSALHVQLQSSSKSTRELQALVNDLNKERAKLMSEIDKFQKQSIETSMMVHESQSKTSELLMERDSLLAKLKLLEKSQGSQQRLEEELTRIKLSLETESRNRQRLQDENNSIRKDLTYMKSQYELKETTIRQCDSDRDRADRERNTLKMEVERLTRELRSIEERYKSRLVISEKETSELTLRRDALEREIQRLQQRPNTLARQTQTDEKIPAIDPTKLLFDGVRRKVTAHQLCDCGIISKATLEQLLNGKKTVEEVSVDIQLSLKGTGIIAGMTSNSQGKMPFTEAKNKNLLSSESALMLLEAQAATGYMVDPTFNDRMPVDTACSRGIVDTEDRDVLLAAEAASTGFKDPYSGKVLSVGQAFKQARIDKETTIRLLQAQDSVGGIIDPVLGVFLPKDLALDRNLIDEDLYRALNKKPACYLDPATGEKVSYTDLRLKCRTEPVSGLLLLPGPEKQMTVKGLRGEVSMKELADSGLIDETDLKKLEQGKLTSKDIEDKLKSYLYGSTCIAGIYDEANDRTMPFYQAMKEGLLMKGTTLELLEAQAASGFMIDPVNNVFLTVDEAVKRGLVGKEFKNKLMSAEKAVTGYTDPSTGKTISLFQAIEKDLIEKGHGIRLLEAQIASGGIIDPKESHRIDVDMAYKRGYFDKEMNEILTYEGDDTKGFFDPNNKDNLTYLQLKERCFQDPRTGLVILPLKDKRKPQKPQASESRTNVLRKRRVVIVDPDTGLEMSVREAYHKELIDYDTFLDLSEQECEWEEITVKASDGSARLVVVDRKTGTQYDIQDSLDRGLIDQKSLEEYRAGKLTLTQFADFITSRTRNTEMTLTASNVDDMVTNLAAPSSPTVRKRFNSISIMLSPPEMFDDQSPVAAIFDTETLEKITILEGLRRGIIDAISAQRLMEAQACTGGIINPANGQRLSLQDAVNQSLVDEDMATKLKPAQKAYIGFEDVKTKRKMSAAEAVKEKWLPYEAGQRFLEFQYLTGGLIEPGTGRRTTIEEAIRRGWLDGRGAQKLQDTRNHQKNLTCPKTKLKISYKEAMDSCMVEESNGMKMLQASSMSTKGISSPYNVSNPGSRSGSRAGSRTGSRSGSRRGSVDYTSNLSYTISSVSSTFSTRSLS